MGSETANAVDRTLSVARIRVARITSCGKKNSHWNRPGASGIVKHHRKALAVTISGRDRKLVRPVPHQ